MHVLCHYKSQESNRHHIYDKLEYTRMMSQRQNRSMLGKSFDYLEAFEDHCAEKSVDATKLSLTQKQDILQLVYAEFNSYGVVGTQSKYQMGNHEKFSVSNLILWVSDEAKKRIQDYLNTCHEKDSPYRSENMSSSRWLIGGTTTKRPAQSVFWNAADVMTAEKQPFFIDRINLMHRTRLTTTSAQETWDQEASHIAWAMHGYLALRSLTIAGPDGTPIPSQSEDQMSTLMRLILEGDYKDEWTAADTMRDDNYGFESYSFWPQPGQDSDMCCIDDRDQRTALEGVLADLSEEQKEKEFMIDLGILMADTTDIMSHYRALKQTLKTVHLHKVNHLREQHTMGATLVSKYMDSHCHIVLSESYSVCTKLYETWKQKKIMDPLLREHHGDKTKIPPVIEIVWLDCSKFGRMDNRELDPLLQCLKSILAKNLTHGVGIFICQTLFSKRRLRAELGERQRVVEKCVVKSLLPVPLNLKISPASHPLDMNKSNFDAYALFADDTVAADCDDDTSPSTNVFETCALLNDRGTEMADRLDPSQYCIPRMGPNSATSVRDLSEKQRSAQLLGGSSVPFHILEPLLRDHSKWGPIADVVVINLSAYEGALEMAALGLPSKNLPRVKSFSVTMDSEAHSLIDSRVKKQLLTEWKKQAVLSKKPTLWEHDSMSDIGESDT